MLHNFHELNVPKEKPSSSSKKNISHYRYVRIFTKIFDIPSNKQALYTISSSKKRLGTQGSTTLENNDLSKIFYQS